MKASQFQFFIGQYEDQSIASLIMTHEEGFNSIQAALESLFNTILDGPEDHRKEGLVCPHCKEFIVTAVPPEKYAGEIFSDFFQSDIDSDAGSHGLYEKLSSAGWNLDSSHDSKKLIQVFKTSILLDGGTFTNIENYVVAPKGIKIYNS